jgi:hypothetical protein
VFGDRWKNRKGLGGGHDEAFCLRSAFTGLDGTWGVIGRANGGRLPFAADSLGSPASNLSEQTSDGVVLSTVELDSLECPKGRQEQSVIGCLVVTLGLAHLADDLLSSLILDWQFDSTGVVGN